MADSFEAFRRSNDLPPFDEVIIGALDRLRQYRTWLEECLRRDYFIEGSRAGVEQHLEKVAELTKKIEMWELRRDLADILDHHR